jgi:Acyl-CoA reductase (LuxC)
MLLQKRIDALVSLGEYINNNYEAWQAVTENAYYQNAWFVPEFIATACQNIATHFLNKMVLANTVEKYNITEPKNIKTVGIVMAGNIPLVGFHDLMCVILSGHKALIKLSSKDEVLIKGLIQYLYTLDAQWSQWVVVSVMLKNCDAYIATGSNNTARYFEYYFNKYPNIIRKNRTSVAILNGNETTLQLQALADDVMQYFGMGCRNVTHIYVPENYNFEILVPAFDKYKYLADHNKLKNNYDYNLALYLLNNVYYMTNGSILIVENEHHFSPISCLHYTYYNDIEILKNKLLTDETIQCIVGTDFEDFGAAQTPSIQQFADGIDTLAFLNKL